jgi:hypothetical protein
MRFAAGENLYFGMFAKAVDLSLGDHLEREDDLDLRSTLSSKGFDLRDYGTLRIPCP